MPADNSHHLITAARERSRTTRRRAITALRKMDTTGAAVTFDALAREAGVSRSWLYSQPDLRADVERLRQRRPAVNGPTPPTRQRASDASLLARLDIASARVRELDSENKRLRAALAEALGERRDGHSRTPRRDTPRDQSS